LVWDDRTVTDKLYNSYNNELRCRPLVSKHIISYTMFYLLMLRKYSRTTNPGCTSWSGSIPKFNHF